MSKIMLVNVTHVEESRVAVLDDGVLAAYEIETLNRTHIKGNIHNAVVESVHASLEASFVKIGPDLKGFLPMDEVNFRLLPARSDSRKQGRIGQHLHQGQKLLVQVVREPFAGKPPSISTYFSLPGRYLVLMPGVDSAGISRKIEDSAHRERLKKVIDELRVPEGFGVIVRTAGLGQTKTELQRDLRYLLRLWESIQRSSQSSEFPSLVYREADLVIRTMRDHMTSDIEEVWIDSEETYEKALEFVRDVMPGRARTLKLHTGDRPLFNRFNLEEQIERIYKRRVPLPSGGEIVIDGTEALTAIDVNTARTKRKGDLEDIVLQTNCEAAEEIARQLRLRDLGGLIVIDFIDMSSTRNKKKVEKLIRDAMRGDRARVDTTTISKLGLMEIARQRIKGAKMAASYTTCPSCEGYGLLKNVETAALAVLRKLQTRVARAEAGGMRVSLPTEVAMWLLNNKREEIVHLERRHRVAVEIDQRPTMLRHENEFTPFPRERPEEPTPAPAPAAQEPARTSSTPPAGAPAPPATAATAARPPATDVEPAAAEPAEKKTPRRSRRRKSVVPVAIAEPGPDSETAATPLASSPVETHEPGGDNGSTPDAPEQSRTSADTPDGPETDAATPSGDDESGTRPRRRRRKRRRGRSGAADGAPERDAAGSSPAEPAQGQSPPPAPQGQQQPSQPRRQAQPRRQREQADPDSAEISVPRNIRSDELMPAASAGSKSRDRRSKSGPAHKRKMGTRGPRQR